MFSKSCEYGIKAVVFIAQQSLNQNRVRVGDVAAEINSPIAFTAKVLQTLSKHQIINSVMGANGGYEILPSQMEKMTLLDIVSVLDGEEVYSACGLGLSQCDDSNPCPIHEQYKKIRTDLELMLSKTTLLILAQNLEKGLVKLKVKTDI
ncbi:Rrf2 family transcriptional regulator [Flavobacteriaceae bacterium Ap0902]|nr:Rrf2 family transcriptional regulator [Flavobacteriaceae bacterium Ap0902]